MAELDDIIEPVKAEFGEFEEVIRRVIRTDSPFLGPITTDILRGGGKRMRPLLTLLSAALHGGIGDRVMASAVLVEMIHWATLVHDDVVDEAYVRRGEWTPGTLLRSKTAVLIGDYLFSKGLAEASRYRCFRAIASTTDAIEKIVEGELLQMEHARRMDTTEEIYTRVIRLKTGVLLASAAECGVVSSRDEDNFTEADLGHAAAMSRFGETLGIAFQIKDDLLDFGFTAGGNPTGKVLCNDLRERKMTLPLIRALSGISPAEQRSVKARLRDAPHSHEAVEWLRRFVEQSDGITYSISAMQRYHNQALEILSAYPDTPVRRALGAYASYVTGRTH